MTFWDGKIIKILFIIFISVISMLDLAYEVHTSKLLLRLFPRPPLSSEALENYWENPLPLPKTMRGIATETKVDEAFCIDISASDLWIQGDEGENIYSAVRDSFELYIDGAYRKPLYIGEEAISFQTNGGSFGGIISACFEIQDLDIGLHSAEVQFADTHGQIYTHTWAFKVAS